MKLEHLFIALVAAFAVPAAHADETPTQCTQIEKGYAEAIQYSAIRQGQLAKQTEPLLKQMGDLANLAKKPDVPVGQQLTREQLDEFQKIRAQLIYLQAEMFVASSRDRDMSILYHLCLASAESETLMESYISNYNDLPESKWLEEQYDKSQNKQYLQLLDHLQSFFPPEYLKQLQQMQQSQQQGASGGSG